MKIAVFGATGKTGVRVVEQALEKRYQVNAFTRSPEKLGMENSGLNIIQGDILDRDEVFKAIDGADAVISVLGPSSNNPDFAISKGMENILAGIKEHGVKRLIVTAGAGVGDPNDTPTMFNKFMDVLIKTMSKNVYLDMVKVVEMVRESGSDWTIVRAPMLTDQPKTGKVNAAWVGKGMGPRISRADFAYFILNQIEDTSYIHQAPAISN